MTLTLGTYQDAAREYVTGQALDFPKLIERLALAGINFDHLVRAELRRRNLRADDGHGDRVGMDELVVRMDLSFEIGVAVGRLLR